MPDTPRNPEHDSDCPVNTGDGPASAPNACRCEYLDALEEGYRTEPPDMFAREWGS